MRLDSHGSVIVVEPDEVESGPLRPSDLTDIERHNMPPHWAWLPHGPVPYELRSDLRTTEGQIVSRGTPCLVERNEKWLLLYVSEGRVIQLLGTHYCVPIPNVPLYRVA